METIVTKLVTTYGGKETEQNWEKVDTLLKELSVTFCKASNEEIISNVKRCKDVIQDTLGTERTRLALTSIAIVSALVTRLSLHYEHLQEFFLYQMLRLCERTNKVLSDRAKSTLLEILKCCPLPVKIVMTRLFENRSSPNTRLRQAVIEALVVAIKNVPKENLGEYEEAISKSVKDGLQDAAEAVRAASRPLFIAFTSIFPTGATT
jgi:hypothetical protein